jgi:DNA-directed RNA polymerase specialized sigma24 family protein
MSPPFASPEALLAHRRFLRPIVRALLRGGDGEDDVVQEALVREWLAGPAAPRAPGSWLARVARNLSFDHLRAARRGERLQQRR